MDIYNFEIGDIITRNNITKNGQEEFYSYGRFILKSVSENNIFLDKLPDPVPNRSLGNSPVILDLKEWGFGWMLVRLFPEECRRLGVTNNYLQKLIKEAERIENYELAHELFTLTFEI